jgi:hypothetical protein
LDIKFICSPIKAFHRVSPGVRMRPGDLRIESSF